METLQIELKNKKQSAMIKELLKELRIAFTLVQKEEKESNLYGEGFRKSIEEGIAAYERGEGIEIKLEDLWK